MARARFVEETAAETVQPAYAFWPWQVLAAAVPLASALGSLGVMYSEAAVKGWQKHELALLAAFTIYGAGNGFLLGAAIGDFGRSMLAMIAGAFAALLLAPLYNGPGVLLAIPLITVVMMSTLALHWTARGLIDAVWTGFGALFIAVILAGLVLLMLLVVAAVFFAVFRTEFWYYAAGVLALMFGNVIFLGRIFRACYRVNA